MVFAGEFTVAFEGCLQPGELEPGPGHPSRAGDGFEGDRCAGGIELAQRPDGFGAGQLAGAV